MPADPSATLEIRVTYSASIATAGVCELSVLRDNGDIVCGPVSLGVTDAFARDVADAVLDRDGWKRTSNWDSDAGEFYADVEFKKPPVTGETGD